MVCGQQSVYSVVRGHSTYVQIVLSRIDFVPGVKAVTENYCSGDRKLRTLKRLEQTV